MEILAGIFNTVLNFGLRLFKGNRSLSVKIFGAHPKKEHQKHNLYVEVSNNRPSPTTVTRVFLSCHSSGQKPNVECIDLEKQQEFDLMEIGGYGVHRFYVSKDVARQKLGINEGRPTAIYAIAQTGGGKLFSGKEETASVFARE